MGSDAGSNQKQKSCLSFKGAGEFCFLMPELKGTDYEIGKGSWWSMGDWNGRKLCDIEHFAMKAGGSNGYGFHELTVIVEANDGKAYVAVIYEGETKWLETDRADHKVQQFPIIYDFGKPKGNASEAKLLKVILICESKGDSGAIETLNIRSNNVKYSQNLYNQFGNDFEIHRTDRWVLTNFGLVDVKRITDIYLSTENPDGWSFDKTVIILQTTKGFYVPVLEYKLRELDGNTAGKEEQHFDLLSGWNAEVYLPEDIERGGYWKYVTAIDPWENEFTITQTARYYSESGTIDEKSSLQGYSDSYTQGGSFSFCQSLDVDLGSIASSSSEACATSDWSSEHSSQWENSVSTSVETRTGQETEISCSHSYSCPAPTIIENEDLSEIIAEEAKCYVYMWVTFVFNKQTGRTEVLETCQFDLIENWGNVPQCVPGTCIDKEDCQKCHDGPQPPRSASVEVSLASKISKHVSDYSIIYGFVAIMMGLTAAGYIKYQSFKTEEDYQLLNMAKIGGSYAA